MNKKLHYLDKLNTNCENRGQVGHIWWRLTDLNQDNISQQYCWEILWNRDLCQSCSKILKEIGRK